MMHGNFSKVAVSVSETPWKRILHGNSCEMFPGSIGYHGNVSAKFP